MLPEIAAQLRALDNDITARALSIPANLYAPLHEGEPYTGVRIKRGIPYGEHPRQRLDLFESNLDSSKDKPIVVFVHGGGYVDGDRRLGWPAYYDNLGLWAARHGMIGAMISYRLAPEHTWPSGAEDVKSVVEWLRVHGGFHSGNPAGIVLMGHSSGATHVASYIVREPTSSIAGAILLSGTYDVGLDISTKRMAYFGTDEAQWANRSVVRGLATTSIPLLVSCTEYDSRKMQLQARNLLDAIHTQRSRLIPAICLPGHTHWSQLFHINASGEETHFPDLLRSFIASVAQGKSEMSGVLNPV